jgi:cobalt-zinc-cadmium efflux system protein
VAHRHEPIPRDRSPKRLAISLGLVVVYLFAEVVGGLLANSLALLADAGHMLADAASLGLALFALWIAQRPATATKTYGYRRAEILAALANGVTLFVAAIFILSEAARRFWDPQPVGGATLFGVAAGGLLVNVAAMWILHAQRDASLNLRGAWLHVVADTLGSLQAIIAGLLVMSFGWNIADPVASALIAGLVLWSAWTLLRETVTILLEATPRHLDANEIGAVVGSVNGVEDVHDLHVWTVTSGFESLTLHARVRGRDHDEVLTEIRRVIRERFGVEHSTVQLERGDLDCRGC